MTYGKNVAISRHTAYQRNHNVVQLSGSKTGLGPVSSAIVLILVMCLLGLMYLTQVTKTNALGYKVSELTTQQTQLEEEYASLEVESERLQNLDRVKNSEVAQNMSDTKPATVAMD
jgi:cell division protein FtsL